MLWLLEVAPLERRGELLGIAFGISEATMQHQLNNARASGTAITRVVTAPDAQTEHMPASGGGTVTVVVSAKYRAAVVTSRDMPALTASRVYQVWVMKGSAARSVGLLGRGGSVLAGSVAPGDKIGITVEPAGGTSQPTTAPVVVMPVSA